MARGARERKQALVADLARWQIVEAFAVVASTKGYAAATITDVVGEARISKTTFYDHFSDKESAYLHLHRVVADATTAAMADSLATTAGERTWVARVDHLIGAYLECMASEPAFLAQVRLEPEVATAAAEAARLAASSRFVSLIDRLITDVEDDRSLPEPITVAGLAGTRELVRRAAGKSPAAVRRLRPTLADLWIRLTVPPHSAAGPTPTNAST